MICFKKGKTIAVVFLSLVFLKPAYSGNDWKYTYQFNVGVNVNFYFRFFKEGFPGMKFFAGAGVRAQKDVLSLNYAASFAFYRKMIGNHFNPLVDDNQVDFANTFNLGITKDNNVGYEKHFRTLGNSQYYNISTAGEYGGFLGTTFIFNNHRRNQSIGSLSINFRDWTLYYANDGGPPIEYISTGDLFDRWWTGSGGLFWHNDKGYNNAEFSFDQFTGYTPLLYELSNLLGINVPDYNITSRDSVQQYQWQKSSFNTSSYDLKVFPDENFAIHLGIIGSLRSDSRYYGVQDLIHIAKGFPMHPNNDFNRLYLGGTYNNIFAP